MFDLIIIGGGPAGLAATVYAARKQLKTLLLSVDIGGQVNWTLGVENYLGYQFIDGRELIDKFHDQVSQFPVEQQIAIIFASTRGYTDNIPVEKMRDFEKEYILEMTTSHQDVLKNLAEGILEDEDSTTMEKVAQDVAKNFEVN